MKTNKKIELLAPAGDFPSLIAAVEAGADAVYFGIRGWNMRDSAKNFDISDLDRIGEICGKVKKYLTLNTIVYDSEISKIERIIKRVKGKVDAVICWDLSVVKLCRKYKIPIHISTQASVSNVESAKFYKKLGAERIVLARELNLQQTKKVSKVIDVEVFCHGAMCVSESGRCFTSQFLHNRSANRGQCTHPCRKSYTVKDEEGNELRLENNKVMSAKDLCALPFVDKLKKAGVRAIKIEGRNRNAEYVSAVTRVYRRALDKDLERVELDELMNELKKVYNRGFSSGFFLGTPTSDDFSRSEDGEAQENKQILGKVLHYWDKAGVAAIKILSGKLKLGDEIYVRGDTTGLIRVRVESMEINHAQVKEAKRGEDVGIMVSKCRKGDEVFIVKKKS